MLRKLGTSLALAFAISCTPAVAQDGRVIIDILQDQLKQYLDREQQKKSQQETYKRFQASWNSCFSKEDLVSCDDALPFPELTEPDRQKLNARRTTLAA